MREPRKINRRTGRTNTGFARGEHHREMVFMKKHGDPLRAMVPAMIDIYDDEHYSIDWMSWGGGCRGSVDGFDWKVKGFDLQNLD